jgi:phosphoribosylanthranilate isomerase
VVFVKVCGVTSEQDALLAVAMGADAVGFVFAPSPRQLAPAVAGDIAKRLPREVVTVGVFRDETPTRVVQIVNRLGLRAAQLHGHETPEDVAWVGARVPLTIKAFPAARPDARRAAEYGADIVLLDGAEPGSGRVFDWRLAEGIPFGSRLMLSGGLTPANVAQAVATVRPWGVDVSTGVESAPGRKDALKMRRFVEAAKSALPDPEPSEADGPYDWAEG